MLVRSAPAPEPPPAPLPPPPPTSTTVDRDTALRILRILRVRSQTVPSASSSPQAENTATLPTTTILSLGLGFIGAALVAIVVTLFLRYYLVTRVYPQRAGAPPHQPPAGGFWARFADWWETFWTGNGADFWEPRYVVRRRPRRPEMWEVLLDEKAGGGSGGGPDGGRDSRLSRATTVDDKDKGGAGASASASAAESADRAETGEGETSAGPRPGVRLVHVAEDEEELGELSQPLAISPAGHAPLACAMSAGSARSGASEGSIAISVLLLMPSQSADPDDLPPMALGTAYLAPESPLPDLGHVRSRAAGDDDDKDELVVDIVHTQPRYPPTFADLAMVRF